MRIGVALDVGFTEPGTPLNPRLDACRGLLDVAAGHDYTSVWFGESYPTGQASFHLPDPLLVIATLARDTGLEIGTGVLLMNAWTRERLAYETAIVDQLCEGRLTIGIAPGSSALRPRLVGEPALAAAAIEEFLVALRRSWREGISPCCWRAGGPPIMLGGRTQRAARRAARLADGYYASSTHTLTAIRGLAEAYLAELKNKSAARLVANRLTVVADSDAEAWDQADRFLQPTIDRYLKISSIHHPEPVTKLTTTQLRQEICLVGSPSTVRKQLRRYEQAGVTDMALRVAPLDMPIEDARRSLSMFGAEVVPYFSGR